MVVSIHRARPGSYYEKDAYYAKDYEQAEYQGEGAKEIGIAGKPYSERLYQQLFNGVLPDGTQVDQKWDKKTGQMVHAGGQDMTFSAPKSVSILAFCSEDSRVRNDMMEAHKEAQREAIKWIEKECAGVNIYKDRMISGTEKTGNLIVSSFTHESSRPVKMPDGTITIDPQLHTHSIIHNMTKDPDGKWRAIAFREFYTNKMLAGAIYHNALERNLHEKGYATERNKDLTFEIKKVPAEAIEKHSQRRLAIEAFAKARCIDLTNAKEMAEVTRQTRANKKEVDTDKLHAQWRQTGHHYKLTLENLTQERDPEPKQTSRDTVRNAIEHLAERQALITEKEILFESIRQTGGRWTVTELEKNIAEMKDHGVLIRTNDGRLATREQCIGEYRICEAVREGKGTTAPLLTHKIDFNEYQERVGFELSPGQKAASEAILTSSDRFLAIQGYAGVGKTTFIQHSAEQIAGEGGYAIRGFAPSAAAAEILQKETGIRSQTLDGFLLNVGKLETAPDHREVWIVDEASMVSTHKMHQLVEAAVRHDAKLILLGDTKQLSSIEAGAAFEQLQKESGIHTVQVTEINRQKLTERDLVKLEKAGLSQDEIAKKQGGVDLYLDAVYDLYKGKPAEALSKVTVHEIKNPDERRDHLVKDYFTYRDTDKSDPTKSKGTLIVTSRNTEKAALNDAIRSALKERGELTGSELKAKTLSAKNMTAVEARQSRHYGVGDTIQFRSGLKEHGIKSGDYGAVTAVSEKDNTLTVEVNGRSTTIPLTTITREERTLTPAQKADSSEYRPGESVTFNRNYPKENIKHGDTFKIDRTESGKVYLTAADGSQKTWTPTRPNGRPYDVTVSKEKESGLAITAYKKEEINLQKGDTIRFTENINKPNQSPGQPKEREFVNGTTATVVEVKNGIALIDYNGDRKELDLGSARTQHIEHAYCSTAYSSQGATADRVLIAADTQKDKMLLGEKTGLVALTRGKHEAVVYTDNREKLTEAFGKKQGQEYALTMKPEQKPAPIQQSSPQGPIETREIKRIPEQAYRPDLSEMKELRSREYMLLPKDTEKKQEEHDRIIGKFKEARKKDPPKPKKGIEHVREL